MGKPIEDPLAPQCGNCVFWDQDGRPDQAGECTGVPPTPALLGAKPRQFGAGVDFQIEMFRPIMAHNARPCALHQRKPVFELGRLGPAKLDA